MTEPTDDYDRAVALIAAKLDALILSVAAMRATLAQLEAEMERLYRSPAGVARRSCHTPATAAHVPPPALT
jgi:hypothetical protein